MIGFYHDENYKQVAKDLYEHNVFDMHEYETVLDVSRKIKTTEEYRTTIVNMAKYGTVLLTTARITELAPEEQNQIMMYICNNL